MILQLFNYFFTFVGFSSSSLADSSLPKTPFLNIAISLTLSSFSVFISFTPLAFLPVSRIWLTNIRIILFFVVIIKTSSSIPTAFVATKLPVLGVTFKDLTPLAFLFVNRYSVIGVNLPTPLAPIDKINSPCLFVDTPIT